MGREDISASRDRPEGGHLGLRWRLEVGLGQGSGGVMGTGECVISMEVLAKIEVYGCVSWNVPTRWFHPIDICALYVSVIQTNKRLLIVNKQVCPFVLSESCIQPTTAPACTRPLTATKSPPPANRVKPI